jgi:undecaprenyl-diphosphatase
VIVAFLVGLSRVMAGVHWPSDILGSFVIGVVCARLITALQRPLSPLLDWVLRGYGKLESCLFRNKA